MPLSSITTFFTRIVAIDRTLKWKNTSSSSNLPLNRRKNTEQYNSAFDASSIKKIINDSSNKIELKVDEERESMYSACDLEIHHPKFISELNDNRIYDLYEGSYRKVYINKQTGNGYKVFKKRIIDKCTKKADFRLNDIYRDPNFYGGKYAKFANNDVISVRDDTVRSSSPCVKNINTFTVIPNSEPLYWNCDQKTNREEFDKIPASGLKMMEDIDYLPFDVKPDNFIKIKNEQGGYDYLPIDAKFIGRKRSSSFRTKIVIELKKKHGKYFFEGKYIDKDK